MTLVATASASSRRSSVRAAPVMPAAGRTLDSAQAVPQVVTAPTNTYHVQASGVNAHTAVIVARPTTMPASASDSSTSGISGR